MLISGDVVAMYPSIPLEDSIAAIAHLLEVDADPVTSKGAGLHYHTKS
jgi:hypothetical protein